MSNINKGTEGQPSEPFRMEAERYIDIGLSVIPVNGKKPTVKWHYLKKQKPTNAQIKKWIITHPEKNIGIVTGKISNITVVDCDDPEKSIFELFELYGETPVVVRTPSGGCHLYYQFNGESSSKLKTIKGDIKADGGLVVAPPSYNKEKDGYYYFIEGDLTDFSNLTIMKPQDEDDKRIYYDGERNNHLFNAVREKAFTINSREELQEFAEKFNQEKLSPPEKQGQVNATVKSVWGYKTEGKLFRKQANQRVFIEIGEAVKSLMFENAPVFTVYFDLASCHGLNGKEFALNPEGYAKRIGKTEDTVKRYKKELIKRGLLKETYKGGKLGVGDTSKYILLRG